MDSIQEIPTTEVENPTETWTFRLAAEEDSSDFADWTLNNNKIPRKDIVAIMGENNPTAKSFVIEHKGKVALYAPFYCQLNLGFIGFNPEVTGKERLKALEKMLWCAAEFAYDHGIREITVQTSKDYPIGKWALKHGFEPESRTTFKFRVTPLVNPFKELLCV